MEDFYLTLPSSSESSNTQNTSSVYTTRLPQVLTLEKDKWVVAATDIIYPYSFKNVSKVLKYYIHFKDAAQPLCFDIPANQYTTSEQVLAVLNRKSRKRRDLQGAVEEEIQKQLVEGTIKQTIESWRDFFLFLLICMPLFVEEEEKTKNESLEETPEVPIQPEIDVNTEKIDDPENRSRDTIEEGNNYVDFAEQSGGGNEDVTNENTEEDIDVEGEKGVTMNAKDEHDKAISEALKKHFEDMLKLKTSESNTLKDTLSQIFSDHLDKLEKLHDKEATSIQKVFNQTNIDQTTLVEALKNVNNTEIVNALVNKMTDLEKSFVTALREREEGVANLSESIENSIKQQLSGKLQYKLMLENVDDSNLEEFVVLREAMYPKTIQTAGEFLQFKILDDVLQVEFKDPNVSFLELDKECAYFLGFHTCIIKSNARGISGIDFFGNISTLYVYCDVVDQTIVGNVKSSLLTVVPCKGKYGEMIQHTFPVPRYLPLMNGSIDSIKVQVLSEFGDRIKFNWGSLIITLHFKKVV